MALTIAYLILGFTLAGIMTVFCKTDTQKDTDAAIALAYLVIVGWPLMLPVFMVMGIVGLKNDATKATRESK